MCLVVVGGERLADVFALHGAKVIVEENGTEAAAATAMGFAASMPPEPDLMIVADRPFLCAIAHQDTAPCCSWAV